jgi:hypothetical protein
MSPHAVGAIFGDSRSYRERDGAALRRVEEALAKISTPDEADIQLVYCFTGQVSKPDWTGLQVTRVMSKRITVSIAVPADWQDEDELLEMGRDAIREAIDRLASTAATRKRKRKIAVSEDPSPQFETRISLPSGSLPLDVLYQFEVDVDKQLQRAGLGSVTGHESGGGAFELSVATRPEHEVRVKELVLRLLEDTGRAAD